jgi:recombinational DNA repair ATPase RecF
VIRIEKIEIIEFRGIRKLVLDFGGKSFGIAGPNGTGKSGIVDAIEFGLTGNITRLGGAGTAEITVRAHAPHVDIAKSPEKAIVRLTVNAPALGKTIVIERSVRAASEPTVTPNDPSTRALLAEIQVHPEFALSRREIIKYILTPAGERSKDVQVLLRLDQIERARLSLQRIANDTRREHSRAQSDDARAKQDFIQHLGIKTATKTELLAAVNERRALLQLEPLTELTTGTQFKQGVIAGGSGDEMKLKSRLSKVGTLADLASFEVYASAMTSGKVIEDAEQALNLLDRLTADPTVLRHFRQKVLLEQGLALIEDEACPLCDTLWNLDELRAHLAQKVKQASAANELLTALGERSALIASSFENLTIAIQKIVQACGQAEPKIDTSPLSNFADNCDAERKTLETVEGDPSLIDAARAVLRRVGEHIPAAASDVIALLKAHAESLPDPSKEDTAKEYLIIAQEKYERCQTVKADMDAAAERETIAAKVFSEYGAVSTAVLEGVYDTVQKDFTAFYSYVNRDDEAKFEGKLTPSVGKLAFDVDFYGRGKFPPGAYHSEGHQDGMGLCLYLALMKHTLGAGFVLAVLDDVLMSVDAGHRREVCSLLKTHFPKTQFILTTHDPVWLQFMRTEHLIQGSINFGGWTVESGPQVWNEGDVWKQIEDKLAASDVSGAAGTLRRYLEFISTILADNLHARVEYHANGHYDLGDLWPAVIQAWKARLQEAKDSAVSWGNVVTHIEALQTDARKRIADTQSEQWMINKAVHYNEWANLQAHELAKVAAAYRDFLKSMQCNNSPCSQFLAVTPPRGQRQALRCGCGQNNFNLTVK